MKLKNMKKLLGCLAYIAMIVITCLFVLGFIGALAQSPQGAHLFNNF